MPSLHRLLPLLALTVFGHAATALSMPPPANVTRRALLTAAIAPARSVATVEVKEITLPPRLAGGLHLHPCPVVGVIATGAIAFQLEGGPLQHLRPGDAFHEPVDTHVVHFDNEGDTPATFTAFYLLGEGQHELIRLIPR